MLYQFLLPRFLLRSNRSALWVSLLSIALAFMLCFVSLSLMKSFQKAYQESLLSFNSHLILFNDMEVNEEDLINELLSLHDQKPYLKEKKGSYEKSLSPFLFQESLAILSQDFKPMVLKGIDSQTFFELYPLQYHFGLDQKKALARFDKNKPRPALILGKTLYDLWSQKKGKLSLIIPQEAKKDFSLKDHLHQFEVIGFFKSGLEDFDENFALIDISVAQKYFEKKTIDGVEMSLEDPFRAEESVFYLEENLSDPHRIISWQILNEPLYESLKIEKQLFYLVISLIMLLSIFNLLGTLAYRILKRRQEIHLLKSLGLKLVEIKKLFTLQALILGLCGTALGYILSELAMIVLKRLIPHFFDANASVLSQMELVLFRQEGFFLLGISLIICYMFSYFTCSYFIKNSSINHSFQ